VALVSSIVKATTGKPESPMHTSTMTRHPLLSPALLEGLRWLHLGQEPRLIDQLVRMGRIADAAALCDVLIADADRP
jgi:hypothetical protein